MTLLDDAAILNRLLGFELAAVETYDHLVRHKTKAPGAWDLQRIAESHRQAVGRLRRQVELLGAEPDSGQNATLWPEVERSEGMFVHEDKAMLQALKEGELRELQECSRGLTSSITRPFLEDRIVPMLQHHVDVLNEYLARPAP